VEEIEDTKAGEGTNPDPVSTDVEVDCAVTGRDVDAAAAAGACAFRYSGLGTENNALTAGREAGTFAETARGYAASQQNRK
jgi:hypothetical protein